jgi:hypothetical protein
MDFSSYWPTRRYLFLQGSARRRRSTRLMLGILLTVAVSGYLLLP